MSEELVAVPGKAEKFEKGRCRKRVGLPRPCGETDVFHSGKLIVWVDAGSGKSRDAKQAFALQGGPVQIVRDSTPAGAPYAGRDVAERGFSGAVRAGKRGRLARGDGKGHVFENPRSAVGFRKRYRV